MTAFCAAYLNERDKVLYRKKYIVFLVLGVIICVFMAVTGAVASGFAGHLSGINWHLTPSPMGVLTVFSQVIIPLLIFMACSDLITAEASNNTMKAMICRPIARWKLYAAKLLAVVTYAAVYLAFIFIVSTFFNQIFGRTLSIGEIFAAFFAYVLTVFPLAVLAAFAAFAALFGRSSSLTMFLLILAYAAMNVLPFIFPVLSDMIFTSYIGWHRLWIGVLPGASRLLHALAIIFGYGVVFFTAGSLVFDKREY
jgi:ABC-2 type transport system permease protein